MTRAIQIYRFESSMLPSTVVASSTIVSGEAAATNHHLGKQLQLGDTFQIYDAGVEQNNNIRIDPAGAVPAQTVILSAGSYDGDDLISEVRGKIQAAFGDATYASSAYSSTTRKYTISRGAGNFDIIWTYSAITAALAYTMGYDPSADDTGAATYTSDDAVYSRNSQFAIWRYATGIVNVERLMVSGTNLASTEQIKIYLSNINHGGLPTAWAAASWSGTAATATQSKTNDTYIWEPDELGSEYLAIFVDRSANTNQDIQDPLKIGAIGIWTNAGFDGADYSDRTIRSVYETNRGFEDQFSEAALGGNLDIGKIRGWRETTMNFGSWPEGAFYALDSYIDKYRAEAHLFLLDPDDDSDPDKVIFGYIPPGGYGPVRGRNTTHVRDFPLTVRTLRMAPEE